MRTASILVIGLLLAFVAVAPPVAANHMGPPCLKTPTGPLCAGDTISDVVCFVMNKLGLTCFD